MNLYRWLVLLASLSLIPIVPVEHVEGQCRVNEGAKLTASDGAADDEFGVSVSVSGDAAVVGAFEDDVPGAGFGSGSAYVYRLNEGTWTEQQKLTASDGATNDEFGLSVSLSGNVAVVGSHDDDDAGENSGSAYVYRFNGSTWVEEQKLVASHGAHGDQFGRSVSVSGNVAVVGARLDSGSAYVYRFDGSTWVEEQKLTASDGAAGDDFGLSVSVSGDVVVVGSPLDDDAGTDSGSAYVYRFVGSTWVEEQKLAPTHGGSIDHFGWSVAVSGDVAVVGAPQSEAAYVYRFDGSTWVEEQKLTASDGLDDGFGVNVSISGDVAVVAAPGHNHGAPVSGAAYVFRFDGGTWVEEQELTPSDPAPNNPNSHFGVSVSVSGDLAVVGAFHDDDACPVDPDCDSGSAYVFGINPVTSDPPCGAIDARQPSAPNGSDPAGWDSIALTFDEPPGELNAEDFAVVVSPPGNAPTVTDVTIDGNTATVHFDDFIATEAWTTITHWPTGAVTRIGYLPADANNDKLSNANDVLFLIDVLNGVIDPAPPAYQTDTDRSGATNANDVLRVIDLLNGAATYDEYLGAELPA